LISHVPRIRDGSFDCGQRIRPPIEDVPRRQPDGATSQPRGVKVALPVGFELTLAVPFCPVYFEGNAVVDEHVLMSKTRHVSLGLHPMSSPLESQSCDCFEARTAVGVHARNPVAEPSGSELADTGNFWRTKKSQV
jgi:hypothetical protein